VRAVNGVLEDGRFKPLRVINLPKRVQAVLVYNDVVPDENLEARKSWLKRLHKAVKDAVGEDVPDFPRMQFNCELVDFSDEVTL